ncbi:MAG: hypothetical protein HC774_02475, partial [Sphingomonadales bacterium]|nr:hypothetical protein [Sphingomonadales bacterium]
MNYPLMRERPRRSGEEAGLGVIRVRENLKGDLTGVVEVRDALATQCAWSVFEMASPGRFVVFANLDEGDLVTPQDVVARVVQTDLQLALDEAQGAFDRFGAAVGEVDDGKVPGRVTRQLRRQLDLRLLRHLSVDRDR